MLGMYSTILILWCFKKLWIVENFTLLIYCSVCHCRLTLYPIIQTRWPSHMWLLYYIPQIWLGQSENTLNFEVLVKNCSVSIFCWNDNTILCVCACAYLLSCIWLFANFLLCSQPGSSLHGIFQARKLKWVAISSSWGSSTQGFNLCLLCFLHWRQILYLLSHQGSHNIVHIR